MSLRDCYKEMQKASGLQVGDKVKILRKAEDNELGWNNYWTPTMTGNVGRVGTIIATNNDSPYGLGISIKFIGGQQYSYPFYVLELVEKYVAPNPEPERPTPYDIGDEYRNVRFYIDGSVMIDDNDISLKELEKLYTTAKNYHDAVLEWRKTQ